MLKYILKRLAQSALILVGVSLIIYILIRCMPVSFIDAKIAEMNQGGATISDETINAMKQMYGLEDNSFLGILKGYGSWLSALFRFDFGTSFVYGEPVIDVIKDSMGVSFAVAAIATIFEFMIAIPLGVTAATHQYSLRVLHAQLGESIGGRFEDHQNTFAKGGFSILGSQSGGGALQGIYNGE